MTYDVFISYSRRQPDRDYAEWLDASLQQEKIALWRDIREIDPFADFTAEIEEGIENSQLVVVCITPDIKRASSFVRREIQYALALKKPVLPLRFTDTVPPISIINNEWIDFTQDRSAGLKRLLEIVRGVVPAPAPNTQPSSDPYYDYLTALYQEIVALLSQTIIKLVDVRGKATPSAVVGMPQRKQLLGGFTARYGMKSEAPQAKIANFHDGFEQYQGRVLLLGEPGAGKSTTLLALARDAIVARLDDMTQPLPILQRISLWDAGNKTPMADWLAQSTDIAKDNMTAMLAQGQCLLLLDALDELGREREEDPLPTSPQHMGGVKIKYDPRKRFIEIIPPNNQVVISCRIEDYTELGEKLPLNGAVTLQPLLDNQIEDYLSDLPDLWNVICADADLLNIARTPLLLSLIAFAFRDRPEDLHQAHDLTEFKLRQFIFERYVHERYTYEQNRSDDPLPFTLQEVKDVLGHVAMINASGGWRAEQEGYTSFSKIAENILEECDFVWRLPKNRLAIFANFAILLDLITKGENEAWRFVHLKLRDYFAYAYSLLQLEDGALYTGNYDPSPAMALGTAAKNDIGIIEKLIHLLNNPQNDPLMRASAARALGEINGKQAMQALIAVLNNRDDVSNVRKSAAWELGKFSDEQAVQALLVVLNNRDDDSYLRRNAAQAVLEISGEQAVQGLIAILHNQDVDSDVRGFAARALGKFSDEQAVQALLAVLNNRDVDSAVRRNAAQALGAIGGEQVVQALLVVLNNRDVGSSVRRDAAHALGEIGSEEAMQALIAVLSNRDDDSYLRGSAAQALGAIGGEQAVQALIMSLSDTTDAGWGGICDIAVRALEQISTPEALEAVQRWREEQIPKFITLLSDSGARILDQRYAAQQLEKIGTPEALEAARRWWEGQELEAMRRWWEEQKNSAED